jgi:hypothetical protein
MTKTKLAQIVSRAEHFKKAVKKTETELYHKIQKRPEFDCMTRTYEPEEEGGPTMPTEQGVNQHSMPDIMTRLREAVAQAGEHVLAQDTGNQIAKASLIVDTKVLMYDVPVTHLLYLEGEVDRLLAFCEKIPVLDSSVPWTKNQSTGLYDAAATVTIKTEKQQAAIVLYDATDRHPAQTQLITKDIRVGRYTTVKHSAAVPSSEKDALMTRLNKLKVAIVSARQEANSIEVEPATSKYQPLLDYIFVGK